MAVGGDGGRGAQSLVAPAVRHRRRELRDRRRAGAVRLERLRLYPIDLEGTVTIDGLDLAMGRVYLPRTPRCGSTGAAAARRCA